MTAVPDIRYARSGDVAIAFQVVGDGPVDLVWVPFFGNVRWAWEQPLVVRFYQRLASFSRLILFDKRGTGLSDRPRTLTLETQMDDIRAVLDAAGSRRAALLGGVQGSQLCALFAATYPERVRELVLYHPTIVPADLVAPPRSPDEARERWGTDELADEVARAVYPSLAEDDVFVAGMPITCALQPALPRLPSSSACWAIPTSPTSSRRSACRRSCSTGYGGGTRRWESRR